MDSTKAKPVAAPTEEEGNQVEHETQTEINEQPGSPPTEIPPLNLTEEQAWAAELWGTKDIEELATALGISPEVLTEWTNQKRFIVEITTYTSECEATTEERQAVALVMDNFSYAQAESIIGLKEGTIKQWALDEESDFNWMLEEGRHQYSLIRAPNADSDEEQVPEPELLSDEQLLAIPLIIEGKTDAEVGEAIGKSRETINRWRNHDENFSKELKAARKTYLNSQIMALSASKGKAITVLNELLESDDEKIKLQAATLLINATSSLPPQKRTKFKMPKSFD